MAKPLTNSCLSKSKALVSLEYALLFVSLCILTLRTIYTEGPAMQTTTLPTNLGDQLYSTSVSACLLVSFVLWIIFSICGKRFVYRRTGLEIGLVLFFIAAVISSFAAPDKRLAVTTIIVFISPILCSILLIQILDCRAKVNVVLAVIVALGILSAYQCFEQLFAGNTAMIEQYQEDPQSLLKPLNIEPDTLQHFLFEQRLYASNVRAYFTTRNSAGSFLLLSFFAALASYIEKFRIPKTDKSSIQQWIFCGILVGVLLMALALTKSKGAIIGFIFAAFLLVIYHCFGTWLKVHRKVILAACLLLVIVGSFFIVLYGLQHDRLPGGNSMLVRWQYWRASAQMVADYPLTGVGPGNFTGFYSHYKPAGALESVSDPHNFLLSVLSQYGPVGLIGFLVMMFLPLWKIVFPERSLSTDVIRDIPPVFKPQVISILLILWLGLLLARLFIALAAGSGDFVVLVYILMRFFVPAFIVFTVSILLFREPVSLTIHSKRITDRPQHTTAILFCALLGVALNNLTDYAIFEPGVQTTFWMILACLVAIDSFGKPKREIVFTPAPVMKILMVVIVFVVWVAFLNYALVPVALSTTKIEEANYFISSGRFDRAHLYLSEAADLDRLSPVASSLNAKLYQHRSQQEPQNNREMLVRAQECFQTAIERNTADFKNYERLAEVYVELSEITTGLEKTNWLDKAFLAASDAIEHYPGCGRLHFLLAQIAEQQGKNAVAFESYTNTITIENQYREQFRQMFPDEKMVSRLGEKKYELASSRIKELSSQSDM